MNRHRLKFIFCEKFSSASSTANNLSQRFQSSLFQIRYNNSRQRVFLVRESRINGRNLSLRFFSSHLSTVVADYRRVQAKDFEQADKLTHTYTHAIRVLPLFMTA